MDSVWTADASNVPQQTFSSGDEIRYFIRVNNQMTASQAVTLTFDVSGPGGVPVFNWSGLVNNSPGMNSWYFPYNLPEITGLHTYTGSVGFQGTTTSQTTVYTVTNPIVVLVAPADGSTTTDSTPAFAWSAGGGATQYQIQIDNDSNFSSPAVDSTTSATAYTPASALADDVYYWRVRAGDGSGNWSSYSAAWTLTVDTTPPAAPTLALPAGGSVTTDNTPSFIWHGSGDAVQYQIQVDDDSSFTSPAVDATTGNTAYTPSSALADGAYYWRVRAQDSAGNWSSYSSPWAFTLDATPPAPPQLVSPADGSTTNESAPAFDWNSSVDAVRYRLQVDDDAGFSSPAVNQLTIHTAFAPPSALADGVYFWRVSARDSAGNWSSYGAAWQVTVDATPPAAPILLSPADGSATTDNTPTFQWSASSGAIRYRLQVADNAGFTNPAVNLITAGTAHTPAPALADGAYFWRVRAKDSAGNWGSYGPVWEVTVDTTPPAAPTLLSPADGSMTTDNTPAFDWSASSGAARYRLQVDDNADFSSPFVNLITHNTAYTPASPLADGAYYWRVRANDSAGNWSSYGAEWQVTVDATPPAAPTLLSPADGSATTESRPTFEWSASSGAVRYRLQVDDDAGFSSPIVNQLTIHTSFTLPEALADGAYHWRVSARDGAGNWSSYGAAWDVTVDTTPPAVPTLLAPADGSTTTDSGPAFDWSASSGAAWYRLQVADNAGFSNPVINLVTSATAHTPASALADGVYYWRVRAKDSAGNWSSYGAVWQVTVDATAPPPPPLVSPADGSTTTDSTPAFEWNASSGAVRYRLQVDDDADFSSPVVNRLTIHTTFSPPSPLPDGVYYWRVSARDGAGNWGSYGAMWTVTVDAVLPAAPRPVAPADGSTTTDNTPSFNWDPSSGATHYQLQVDDDADFSSPIVGMTKDSTAHTLSSPLPDGVYYWRVRAGDGAGNWSDWTAVWSFAVETITAEPFTIYLPSLLKP